MHRVKKYIKQNDALMTSQFARESREKDQTRGRPEDRRKEQVDRRPDRNAEALNKYQDSRQADRRPSPPPHQDITPLNFSVVEIIVIVQDKNLITWPQPL